MGKITAIFLAIITSFTANSFAFGQTAPELPQLITQLHDPVTSDEASIKLKALAANNADARRVLVKELPELISKTSQDSSRYIVWINSVQLAGELKIEETIPVLVSLFDPARYGRSPLSTMFSRATFANDPVAKTLVQIGKPAIVSMSGILENKGKDQYTRLRAARVLHNMNFPEADAALVHDLQTETDPRVRSFIARLLQNHEKSK